MAGLGSPWAGVRASLLRPLSSTLLLLPLPELCKSFNKNSPVKNFVARPAIADWLTSIGLLILSRSAFAAEETLQPLRGPHGELGPGFWEKNGFLVLAAICGGLGVLVLLVGWLRRPVPLVAVPPEVAARTALAGLRGRPEDAALAGEVSRIFRRYLVFAFALPPMELTTTELVRALSKSSGGNPSLVESIADFLRRCDRMEIRAIGAGVGAEIGGHRGRPRWN